MPFGLISDDFYDHPKVADAPDSAVCLWARALSYTMRHLTDGVITDRQARRLCDNPDEAIKYLTEVGLWDRVDGGYQFHDIADYNPTREAVLTKRADNAARQQAWRDRRKAGKSAGQPTSPRDVGVTGDVTNAPTNLVSDVVSNGERNALRTASRNASHNGPVTAPPTPTPAPTPGSSFGTTSDQSQTLFPTAPSAGVGERATKISDSHRFDEFWESYPHKRDKDAARRAWTKVVRASVKPGSEVVLDEVIAGAGFYRHSREFVSGHAKYPATFLNAGSWHDYAAGPPAEIKPVEAPRGFDAKVDRFAVKAQEAAVRTALTAMPVPQIGGRQS